MRDPRFFDVLAIGVLNEYTANSSDRSGSQETHPIVIAGAGEFVGGALAKYIHDRGFTADTYVGTRDCGAQHL